MLPCSVWGELCSGQTELASKEISAVAILQAHLSECTQALGGNKGMQTNGISLKQLWIMGSGEV